MHRHRFALDLFNGVPRLTIRGDLAFSPTITRWNAQCVQGWRRPKRKLSA
jgi:hypothetical protein